ncbi:DsbA family protein [Fluviispira sanaruensis]|uniref:Uncharacterized protein n=1 Tax=Fluviispira sanaruensis TaxID=2493639 RepID=A0A4P2VN47_FLUSA|nr:hypothetical protein [Fluviispira sanaruensis]BBH52969.1 hypothetical protein JCM31447_14120 [Fluviispira sanaruensis]
MAFFKKYFLRIQHLFLIFGIIIGLFAQNIYDSYKTRMNVRSAYIEDTYFGKKVFKVDGKIWSTTSLPLNSLIEFENLESNIYNARKEFYEKTALLIALANENGKQNDYDSIKNFSDLLIISQVDEVEAKNYFDESVQKYGSAVFSGQTFSVIKNQLIQQLNAKKTSEKLKEKLKEFIAKERIEIFIDNSKQGVIDQDLSQYPSRGNLNSSITLAYIFDYENPKSFEMNKRMNEFVKRFSDRIKFVYVPITKSLNGMGSTFAKGAYCIQKLDNNAYFAYHNRIMEIPVEVLQANSEAELVKVVQSIHLLKPIFINCLKENKTKEYIHAMRNNFLNLQESFYLNRKLLHTNLKELEYTLKKKLY